MTPSLETIRALRSAGRIADSLAALNALLPDNLHEPTLAVEGIHLMLLADDAATAHRLYEHLVTLPLARMYMRKEFLCRLKIMLPDTPIAEIEAAEIPYSAGWVEEYLKSGSDRHLDTAPSDVAVECLEGPVHYDFTVSCPHCDCVFTARAKLAFGPAMRQLCPDCLGATRLRYPAIREFLLRRHPALVSEQAHRWDAQFGALQRELSTVSSGDTEVPLLARRLGQQYVFLTTHLLMGRILDDGE